MRKKLFFCFLFCVILFLDAQEFNDYLPSKFHNQKREILRSKMPKNSVIVIFSNPIRNRSNDVNYIFHQDPDFYYLTGFNEPNSVLVIYSDNQTDEKGITFNEVIYVPKRDIKYEMWNGKRLGVSGVKKKLGFKIAKTSESFINNKFNFKKFNKVFIKKFKDDYRNSKNNKSEIYDLVNNFKEKAGYDPSAFLSKYQRKIYKLIKSTPIENSANVAQVIGFFVKNYPNLKNDDIINKFNKTNDYVTKKKIKEKVSFKSNKSTNINTTFLPLKMAEMREIKTKEELKLLTKAIRISAIGQIEVMKAMKPNMSEREIQGIHEFVYKKYGVEYEGYLSIIGSGSNGCVLHYIKNSKKHIINDLVLMDLGAEYRGYTADVTRTIPVNGKFSKEQKEIYNIVLKAQNAGIKASKIGNNFWKLAQEVRKVINEGLFKLGIIKSIDENHNYLPHGISHHIGLDVHDPGTYKNLQENMVITIEPGIYIPKGSNCDKKWWGIAIRVEDDILITKQGPKNLSEEAPRSVENIEKMMAKKSVLNQWILPDLDK